ncbi:Uncharacterised protein [Bacteroides uniformis]|uniref:Uncharacterized protein n=1 Tax=Bacteroides uniformis TaxID=820 RepID=A0A174HGB5_BACUN|nr:Uncharacterised protein [Bacteroides uniformis]
MTDKKTFNLIIFSSATIISNYSGRKKKKKPSITSVSLLGLIITD